MKKLNTLSRRSFIRNMSLASGALILACNVPSSDKEKSIVLEDLTDFNPNLFVQLKSNGDLILIASRSEMGQGVRTSLTSVIADEMDADWSKVTVKQATGDEIFGNQNTDGSRSIRTLYEPMRKMGAMAKAMLITAASKQWGIDTSQCKTENHFVINKISKDKIFYGDLVEEASKLEPPIDVTLKSPDDFVYIGKGLKSVDVYDFAT
ncbi:MAG: molybdopterin-dependent oxidoreductase [Flavobacteriaceae bacterium]|nr:molybdopterin-dependent oxidoreductase [Flavobacteriaceae bacterium]